MERNTINSSNTPPLFDEVMSFNTAHKASSLPRPFLITNIKVKVNGFIFSPTRINWKNGHKAKLFAKIDRCISPYPAMQLQGGH
jgi:hypothetical protein